MRENNHVKNVEDTLAVKKLHDVRKDLCNYIRNVGQSRDLSLLLNTEYSIVDNDLSRYANSPEMKSSLKTALTEINVVKEHTVIVADPTQYQLINKAHSLSKNRKNGLPYDEARQAMASHYTRLGNLNKSRLTSVEKSIIDARRDNMKVMCRLYEQMQAKALGIHLSQNKDISL
ncbi:hypothetical protein [Bartonella schoenbuchensis]|uniref:Uncharacterized protein n=1 Tax=Bartonella schoenbuchensis (strain DSM 13525 / NCTC 13165 / R1) TaxID=687861 RepID=A0A1S6XSW8_BARSR|nr:hypothetical protein [Bartonella schoenbuchensis]AQX31533.1 hypothetical protein BscR1v2_016300 [Bartonella schoenbuchensis R1]